MEWKKRWQELGWMVAGALCASGAAAQDSTNTEDEAPDRWSARVELGQSPDHYGFKLVCQGGEPFARGLMEVHEVGSELTFRDLVALDAQGEWSRTLLGVEFARDLEVTFLFAPAGGHPHVKAKVKVPAHKKTVLSTIQSGQILVREFMKDPTFVTDTKGEWIEVVNLTAAPIDLRGWKLEDSGTNSHTIGASSTTPILALPGVPFVLGNNATTSTNGGVTVDYKYSNFTLGNGADQIILRDSNGVLVDRVDYDDGIFWPDTPGKSISLNPSVHDVNDADDPANWCESTSTFSAGNPDRGTPGLANDICP